MAKKQHQVSKPEFLDTSSNQSQTFLEVILEHSPVPMWIGDSEGTLIRTNKALRDAVGVTDEELVGIYHPLKDPNVERAGLTETIRKVIEDFEPARFTLMWKPQEYWEGGHSEARERHMDMTMFPIVRDGKLQNLVAQWQDITEQQQALKQVADNLTLVNESQAAGHIGSWEYDVEQDKITWSDEMYRIIGIDKGSPLPGWEEMCYAFPQDWERLNSAVQKSIAEGIPYKEDFRILRPDGEVRWGLVQGSPVKDANAKTVRLIGTMQDITNRKHAEIALRESEQRFQAVFNSVDGVPIQGYDKDRRVILWNPASETLYGYSRTEAIGRKLEDLIIPEEDKASVVAGITQWHEKGIPIPSGEVILIDKSGTRLQVYSNHIMIINHYGEKEMFCIDVDLSERKRFENSLRESEEQFRAFVENANDIIYQVSPEGVFTYASPNWTDILGYELEEVLGKKVDNFVHPDDVHLCMDFLQKVLSTEERQSGVEYRVRHKNGTWRWHNSNGAPVKDNEGTIVSYIGIARDVTEIKEKEKARSELYERYQTVIKNFPNGAVFLFDKDLNYIHVEGTALKEVGLVKEEMIGKSVQDVFPPGVSDIATTNQQLLFEGKTCYFEVEFAGKTYANWGKPVISTNNQIEEGVIFAVDITHQKQAEKELIRNHRSLELHNSIATVFLTNPRDEVYADVLNVILKVLNSRFGYFGYIDDAGDLVCPSMTRDIWDQCQMPEKTIVFPQSKWGGLWGRSLLEKRTLVANDNLNAPAGHVELSNALATPIMHQNNLLGQFVVANKAEGYNQEDIDLIEAAAAHTAPILYAMREEVRQKASQEKLEEQLRQAQKMEAVGRLAGGVAHDFNNMLSVVIGHAELILEEMQPEDPFYEDLKAIQQAGIRSADLTRQLLAFARQQTVAPKLIDLNKTVEDMLKMLQRLIGENIEMIWDPGNQVWPIKIDPSQIDQILANLCVNARDAIPGVGKVIIKTENVSLDQEYCDHHEGFSPGEYAMISVQDDGKGMDGETLSHLFEPFFTTKDVGKGTGLGLSTVYGVIKQNNGLIGVESEPQKGTTFKIYFPRHATKLAKAPEHPFATTLERGHETILLVEDEPSIMRMTTTILERQGYQVIGATNPGEAIQLAREHAGEIQLLLTDVVMPEMNGRDLVKNILSLYPDIKCIFMSGYTAKVIAHHGVLDEGINFIQKPFSKEGLVAKVREVLNTES